MINSYCCYVCKWKGWWNMQTWIRYSFTNLVSFLQRSPVLSKSVIPCSSSQPAFFLFCIFKHIAGVCAILRSLCECTQFGEACAMMLNFTCFCINFWFCDNIQWQSIDYHHCGTCVGILGSMCYNCLYNLLNHSSAVYSLSF